MAREICILDTSVVCELIEVPNLCSNRDQVALQDALAGKAPFVPVQSFEQDEMVRWLREFPQWVMRDDSRGRGSGLGDLTLVQEWKRQRQLNPHRRVYIWSLDQHLAGYDSGRLRRR